MFKDFIKEQAGVQIYPIISLLIFVLFFSALAVYAMMIKKSTLNSYSHIPLDDNENINENSNNQ